MIIIAFADAFWKIDFSKGADSNIGSKLSSIEIKRGQVSVKST